MALDPQAQRVLDQLAALNNPPYTELSPEEARRVAVEAARQMAPGEPVAEVAGRRIAGPGGEIPIRVYQPGGAGPHPVVVYFHGGGWVICDLDTHDMLMRRIVNAAGAIVVGVDYRLAPEHKFPAGLEDCYAATRWVADHADSIGADGRRIAVAGDSAGGNLAAAVSLLARDRGGPPLALQLLVYPITDRDFETPSYRDNAAGYLLSREVMIWFWNHYIRRDEEAADPLASPLLAGDLSLLPPAHIITAEYDPLRDEGEAYARRLATSGVPVTLRRYDGMIHDFFRRFAMIDQGAAAVAEAAEALKRAFGT